MTAQRQFGVQFVRLRRRSLFDIQNRLNFTESGERDKWFMQSLNDGLFLTIELGNDDSSGVKGVSQEAAQAAF